MNADNYKYSEITEQIIEAFYKGYNALGYGFLEKVYENALFIELVAMGLFVEKQKLIKIYLISKEPQPAPSFRQGLPESRTQGCEK
ncbi:GxxExxY protein [Methylobacter svalbardensis]|uniref:GxxExxY protein n=1 Tax=Methylobacter svalbardensis TaxID=3080016 RepID=UPI0030ECE64E